METFSLCLSQQISVGQLAPTPFIGGFNLVCVEEIPKWDRRSLIEKNAQSGNLGRAKAFGCMFKDIPYLLVVYAGKPLQELGCLRPILKVFEQSGNRHPGATEYPLAAHAP